MLNINGSKWNAHVGVTGGTLSGTAKSTDVRTELDAPFATIYGFVSNGAFTFDLSARKEWHDAEFFSPVFGDKLGHKVAGSAEAVQGVATYRFQSGNWFLTPAVGLSYTRTHLDAFTTGAGLARIAAGSDEALIGQMALQLSYAIQIGPGQFLQPYVSAAAQRNFTNTTDALLTIQDPNGALSFDTKTIGVGDSMKYTVGIAGADTGLGITGFVQGSIREGDRISGGSVMVGGRINF